MLGRRIGRYWLFARAHPAGDDVGYGFGCHMIPRRFGGNPAVGVPRICSLPKPDSPLIGFDAPAMRYPEILVACPRSTNKTP